ncbi:metal-dependent hydrolase [Salibacterium halotolerans]|uniref:Inner membrane protein n=1 Tax=Salibacterium halotolerans TaxID=1884432 RepID=A0A1I5USD0_9BACI|nr:metal-dependent hydrolase [Salibacterium halotolerans]SFP97646.1 inner membrane protein [Salibacterium halotolerans]
MNAGTHTIGALAAGTAVYWVGSLSFSTAEAVAYTAAVLIGGLLPDICQPFSWFGRRIRPVSTMIQKLFGHRTITHSILFMAVLYLCAGLIPYAWGTVVQYGITTGAVSHLLLDMMTPQGIHLLYPVKQKISFPLTTKTGSKAGEGAVSFLMLCWIVYFGVHFI